GPTVRKYGSSPMLGNGVCPSISTGWTPSWWERSISTGWVRRERLATTRTVSDPRDRSKASTLGLSGKRNRKSPRDSGSRALRCASICLVHHHNDEEFAC